MFIKVMKNMDQTRDLMQRPFNILRFSMKPKRGIFNCLQGESELDYLKV